MRRIAMCVGVLALSLGLLVGAAGSAAGDDSPMSVAFDAAYASQYYWRGALSLPGSFVMPSLDVSYATGDLVVGANVWYAQGTEASEFDEAGHPVYNSEVDYTVYAGAGIGPLSVSAGAIDYVIPTDPPFKSADEELKKDGHVLEVFGAVSVADLPFDNSVQFSINVDGDDDDSWYLSPSVGYTHGDITCGLAVGIASGGGSDDPDENYYGNKDTAVVDITPSVSYAIPVSHETEAAVTVAIGYNPDAKVTVPFFTLEVGWSGI